MNASPTPIVKELVLVGGGHSHVAVLKSFGMKPMPGVRITLICKDVNTPYSGMLPGYLAGHYTYEESHIDLRPLANFAGAQFYHAAVTGIDLEERRVHFADRPPARFDVLSINTGSTPNAATVPGAKEHALGVKPIDQFLEGWKKILARKGEAEALRVATVGGGAGGVELTLATQFALKQNGIPAEFCLFTDTPEILPTHNPKVRQVYERIFKERQVTVHAGEFVTEVTPDEVVTKSVRAPYDALFWVTNASPPKWIAEAGLKTDDAGFVAINPQLQSESHPFVFAAGDVASCAEHPRPKSGVFAVRQGPPLTRNLRLACADQELEPFRPQRKFLSLISTGEKYAVASRGGFMIQGERVWKWKDWIDRTWMRKYQEMPEMDEKSAQAPPKQAPSEPSVIDPFAKPIMHCGGCGSKVGSTVLSRVLRQLHPIERDDVLVGLDSPDDAAVTETPPGKVAVHTVDFFRSFLKDPYIFGKIAANHALSDIFAMGADPQLALAMAVAPHGDESAIEEQLFQVLSGAIEVMNECGCALGGGHSTEDTQLAFGLSVQGLSDREDILRKGGMLPGERLILTKPVGTGTLFAADMRQKARGDWITNAIEVMLQLNQEPAKILRRHGATACTDVTGFGLLGHLTEMLKASSVGAEVEIEAVPLLEGAAETIEAGILSSLHPENVRIRRAIKDESTASQLKNYPVLFDPQTSGGLLASVAESNVEACLDELREHGCDRVACVGTVVESRNPNQFLTIH